MHILHRTSHAFKNFASVHDDLPAFKAGYLVLTVITAALFPLGAFFLLIVAHASLDLVKYREHMGLNWAQTGEGILRENLLDITLLGIGFVFAMYFHHTIGIAGVSGVLRADITIIRGLGTLIPKAEILNDFLHVMGRLWTHLHTPHERIGKSWNSGEKLCFFVLTASVILLVTAPTILHIDSQMYFATFMQEMALW